MKKIISIDRELTFATMIKEISSICLDHTLKFTSKNSVLGDLIISGTYKMTEASRLEEDFEYKIPVDITTTENYNLDTTNVEIDDFTYEIVNDNILSVKIDILLEGVEEVLEEKEEELVRSEEIVRECDGDDAEEKEIDIPFKEENTTKEVSKTEEDVEILEEDTVVEEEKQEEKSINSLFMNLTDEDETFSTYLVYIMRKNDSIENILDKYGITREELSNYNELENISVGDKLIIPCSNNE